MGEKWPKMAVYNAHPQFVPDIFPSAFRFSFSWRQEILRFYCIVLIQNYVRRYHFKPNLIRDKGSSGLVFAAEHVKNFYSLGARVAQVAPNASCMVSKHKKRVGSYGVRLCYLR